jgi:parallel beta-helix repeat protein
MLIKAMRPVIVNSGSLEGFLAKGDGVTDDSDAIQLAANSGMAITGGGPDKTYRITKKITWPSFTNFDGQGCKFDASSLASPLEAFTSQGTTNAAQPIASGAVEKSISIVLTNTPVGVAEGDWIIIQSADFYPYIGYNVNKGEAVRVRSVNSGTKTIVFTTPLVDTYTTTANLITVNWVTDVHLKNFRMIGAGNPAIGDRGVVFRYVNRFSIQNANVDQFNTYNIEVSASLIGDVMANTTHGNFYNGTTGTIFYGIAIIDCSQFINVCMNKGDRNRHLVVTSAHSTGQGYWGQPMFCDISLNIAWDSMAVGAGQSYLYESHGFGRFNHWHHNQGNGGYAGMRIENGSDCTVEENTFINYAYTGIYIGSSSSKGTIKNLHIFNNRISNQSEWYAGGNLGQAAIYVDVVDGGAGIFENLRIEGNSILNPFYGTFYKPGIYIRGQATGGYKGCSCSLNSIYSDADHDNYIINIQADADGWDVIGNKGYGFRSGILAGGDKTIVKNNVIKNPSAPATGFGLYSSGAKNVFQGNIVERLARLGSFVAASSANLAVNNQSLECTTGTISDAGSANVLRDNDIIV